MKQYQEAVRQSKLDAFFTTDFKPQPYMRSLKEVLAEYERPEVSALVLAADKCTTLIPGVADGPGRVMRIDRNSIEIRREVVLARDRKRNQRLEAPGTQI